MYMYQFGQYAWTHMILLVVFIPSSFFVSNIFDGLMWFLLPCSLVIINDIGAYLFGKQPARMFGTAPNRIYGLSLGPLLELCAQTWQLSSVQWCELESLIFCLYSSTCHHI